MVAIQDDQAKPSKFVEILNDIAEKMNGGEKIVVAMQTVKVNKATFPTYLPLTATVFTVESLL